MARRSVCDLIGVDTPATVYPRKAMEYFGKETSAFLRRLADGQTAKLKEDRQMTDRGRYVRLLSYVDRRDGQLINTEIIAQAYGSAYISNFRSPEPTHFGRRSQGA